jgi:hypothetical protein
MIFQNVHSGTGTQIFEVIITGTKVFILDPTVHKKSDEKNPIFYLLLMVSGTSLISKK